MLNVLHSRLTITMSNTAKLTHSAVHTHTDNKKSWKERKQTNFVYFLLFHSQFPISLLCLFFVCPCVLTSVCLFIFIILHSGYLKTSHEFRFCFKKFLSPFTVCKCLKKLDSSSTQIQLN